MSGVLGIACALAGTAFMALAAFGLLRMPDVYLRLSATSKSSTLGVALLLLGAALFFGQRQVTLRAAAIVLFVYLTTPVASHMIGRAARRAGVRQWEGAIRDDMDDRPAAAPEDAPPLA